MVKHELLTAAAAVALAANSKASTKYSEMGRLKVKEKLLGMLNTTSI